MFLRNPKGVMIKDTLKRCNKWAIASHHIDTIMTKGSKGYTRKGNSIQEWNFGCAIRLCPNNIVKFYENM
jgi:hypothetical protein